MSRSRSDLSINLDACQILGFLTVKHVNDLIPLKCQNKSISEHFFAKEMRIRTTKNHHLAAVQGKISPNLLKKPARKNDRKFLSSWLGRYKWLRYEMT